MREAQREIVSRALWGAAGSGVMIGPGLDAGPLFLIWVGGFIALAREAGFSIDEDMVKKALATLTAGFVAWYISGEIAQVLAAAFAGFAATITVGTLGLGAIFAVIVYLAANSLVNVFFTYKFLNAVAKVMDDAESYKEIVADSAIEYILSQMMDLRNIDGDLRRLLRIMM